MPVAGGLIRTQRLKEPRAQCAWRDLWKVSEFAFLMGDKMGWRWGKPVSVPPSEVAMRRKP